MALGTYYGTGYYTDAIPLPWLANGFDLFNMEHGASTFTAKQLGLAGTCVLHHTFAFVQLHHRACEKENGGKKWLTGKQGRRRRNSAGLRELLFRPNTRAIRNLMRMCGYWREAARHRPPGKESREKALETEKRPSVKFGGVLSSGARKELWENFALVEAGKKTMNTVPAKLRKFIHVIVKRRIDGERMRALEIVVFASRRLEGKQATAQW